MKKVIARGRLYFEDSHGNLILAVYVKENPIRVKAPKDVFSFLTEERTDTQENLMVFTLDGNNQVIKKHRVTRGLANQSQLHPREIFSLAFEDRAVSILIAHNHPSGNLEPSESDLSATRRLVEVSKTLGIPILDHLIVTSLEFLSLRDRYPAYFA